jgi:adenine-specific DNA-methyltransferase
MQKTLIQRYLGNKTIISQEIVDIVRKYASPGDLVFDAFSGSLAVSAALRGAGFEVACNDINHFSWLFARAYFSENKMPDPPGMESVRKKQSWEFWQGELNRLTSEDVSDIPEHYRRTDIFDHYCEQGKNSAFFSKRGASGRRRFFSASNALSIDRALNRIRYRYRAGDLTEQARCVLTSALISSVEKVSNTQGTYHDFPRDFVDSRALKPLTLKMPDPAIFSGPASRYIGKAEDSLEFVKTLPPHKVIYIDPPYNFRQYTSYYFMLNLLSKHAEIDDLDSYFSQIEFVRGQNMDDDFKSSFCSQKSFIPSLRDLILRANADYVILSYFDGRNHWGNFKSQDADTEGQRLLEQFFHSDLFEENSLEFIPVERTNYQSYGGHSAKAIKEFLFVAKKSRLPEVASDLGEIRWIGQDSALEKMS